MPEYLAPGVYVEEIDTGSKPIEGVSTSTAGTVGVTERGPVDVPILITSFGEYRRWFGDYLNDVEFSNANGFHCYLPHAVEGFFTNGGRRVYVTRVLRDDALRAAVNLFDRGDAASVTTRLLRGAAQGTGTAVSPPLISVLAPGALGANDWIRVGDGSRAEYRQVFATAATTHLSISAPLAHAHVVGGGINVQQFTRAPDGAFGIFNLAAPAAAGDFQITLTETAAGDAAAVAVGALLEIGSDTGGAVPELHAEFRFITDVVPAGANVTVELDSPLGRDFGGGDDATLLLPLSAPTNATPLAADALPGDVVVFGTNLGAFVAGATLLQVDGPQPEVRRIAALQEIPLLRGAYEHYPRGTRVEQFQSIDDDRTINAVAAPPPNVDTVTIQNGDVSGLAPGQEVTIDPGGVNEVRTIRTVDDTAGTVTFTTALASGHAAGTVMAVTGKQLSADTPLGSVTLPLNNRLGLAVGDVLRIGVAPNLEYATITAVSGVRLAPPDAGTVVLTGPTALEHLAGTPVRRQVAGAPTVASLTTGLIGADNDLTFTAVTPGAGGAGISIQYVDPGAANAVLAVSVAGQAITVDLATNAGSAIITTAADITTAIAADPAASALVTSTNAPGDNGTGVVTAMPTSNLVMVAPLHHPAYVVLAAQPEALALLVNDDDGFTLGDLVRVTTPGGLSFFHELSGPAAPQSPAEVELNQPLAHNHGPGEAVVQREPLFLVQGLDAGRWGDRLRVSIEDEATGLISGALLTAAPNATTLELSSLTGVEPGTLLELSGPNDADPPILPLVKVDSIVDLAARRVALNPGLDPAQMAIIAGLPPGQQLRVRSREFRLTVRLMRRPDPANPTKNDIVLDRELFLNLSMDPRHSRYFVTVIGDINGPLRLYDRRPEGSSWYIRVEDLEAVPANRELVRLGPEALVDVLPSGRIEAARRPLTGGDDSIPLLNDTVYIGVNAPDPEDRTGLQSLRNLEEISIIACPGRTSSLLQGALISQCEELRYRFAVLDAQRPPNDSIADVRAQRQQFDTRYAAIYHPWLVVPHPFPPTLTSPPPDYQIPPSGHVVGIYARTDVDRGVHKAPANEVVRGVIGLNRSLNKGEHDILNPSPVNINVIRDFRPNNRGIRVWGGRVITSDPDWKYINVRRLLIFIEASLDRGLQWVVFEPNAEPLWARVRRTIINFLTVVWRNGALEGTRVEEAFFVKCDRTTMTQAEIDNGQLICVIGVAPVKPAEFVIIRIGLWTAHAEAAV